MEPFWTDILHALESKPYWRWLAAVVAAVIATGALKLFLHLLSTRLRKLTRRTVSNWDDVAVDLIDGLKPWVIFVWALYLIGKPLQPPEGVQRFFLIAVVLVSSFQIGLWGLHLIFHWQRAILQKRIDQDPSSSAALGLLYRATQTLFLTLIVLIGLSNLGINISALLAGLGVGGIAVALAAQNVLGDLLASLSIVLDKPFVVGDFIIAGDELGTVEQIGIKTTRLRSLSGEQLVLSNKDLLESRVRNYKRMWERRVVQQFGVLYSTPADIVEKIPTWVREIIGKHPKLRFDRCHFNRYGESSLDYEFVFYVLDPEYNTFMDLQQAVLIDIFRKFAAENVDFAFPTRTVFVEKLPARAKEPPNASPQPQS